jgi:hypothetical protein
LIEHAIGSDFQQVIKAGIVYVGNDWEQDANDTSVVLKASTELANKNLWRTKFFLSYCR